MKQNCCCCLIFKAVSKRFLRGLEENVKVQRICFIKTFAAQIKVYYFQPAEESKENENNAHTITTPRHSVVG